MSLVSLFFFILLIFGLLVFFILIITALRDRRNVRAGARLGPGSFFFEVNDQKRQEPKSLEK
jgi:hypothetical protein